jgi:small subunit ribosomal protein S2
MSNTPLSTASISKLLQAGVHLGHKTRRWNPKMLPYIHSEQSGVHIINLEQTQARLQTAFEFLRTSSAMGKRIAFVGTKKQASEIIEEEAKRCGASFVSRKWLSGLMTNFDVIKPRLNRLRHLEKMRDTGALFLSPKKEQMALNRELFKLERSLGGLKNLYSKPDIIFVVDQKREKIAVTEALKSGITLVGIVDTDSNPDGIDFVIPANDDSVRSIRLLTRLMADAILEGKDNSGGADPQPSPVCSGGPNGNPDLHDADMLTSVEQQ